jgi:glycosyltransferase involved in cell wall biosynthesis
MDKMKVIFLIPCYNASLNIESLATSLVEQKNDNWSAIFIDDMSIDETSETVRALRSDKFTLIKNKEKKYALKNIVDTARTFQNDEDIIIAIVDGDDSLCNENTVDLLIEAYSNGKDVVWTGHVWDVNGLNISKPMPDIVDPYAWPWCSSHLKTFKASLISKISDDNFINTDGTWFKRGYDQALMLPIIHVSSKRHFVPDVCYRYNINSVSIPKRDYAERSQISTINIVRSRGFLG